MVGGCRGGCNILLSYILPSAVFMSHLYHSIFILYVFLNLPSCSLYLAATLVFHWFTDSLSAFQSVCPQTTDHLDLLEVLQEVWYLPVAGNSVLFCWIPGHTSLPGNKATSAAAKEASLLWNLTSDWALDSDIHAFILHTVLSFWQDEPRQWAVNY
jgi:hypothetical protein